MLGLVADIGGTNARFAVAEVAGGVVRLSAARTLKTADFPSLDAALRTYLDAADAPFLPAAAVAVAGPVASGAIRFTNNSWAFSAESVGEAFGFEGVRLLNDFEANAQGLSVLEPQDVLPLGGPTAPAAHAQPVRAVLGPGTGFGVGYLVEAGGAPVAIATEGGHALFAPQDEVEDRFFRWLRERFGRASIERALSGPGLACLYAMLSGKAAEEVVPETVVQTGLAESDATAADALGRFCAMLGAVAGDVALTLGAQGGVYITGGVAGALRDLLPRSRFRARFEDKGRFKSWCAAVPTLAVVRNDLALVGAAAALRDFEGGGR